MTVMLVGLGGFLGSILRYILSKSIESLAGSPLFPWGTLTVNVVGCLSLGILVGLSEQRDVLSPNTRAFLALGLLGGFTTFSAFGNETIALWRDGHTGQVACNIALQLAFGLGAVYVGLKAAKTIWGT